MTIPSVSWSETSPAGSDDVSQGDDRIRELKTQIRQVIDNDHQFNSSGQDAANGQHKQVTFLAPLGSDPTNAANTGFLYTKDVNSVVELFWLDESGNSYQLTTAGRLSLDLAHLSNETNLQARNNADSSYVNLIRLNSSDEIIIGAIATLPDGSKTATTGAPTTDAMIANKKYVDDRETAILAQIPSYGTRVSQTIGTTYQAATDGIVTAYIRYTSGSGHIDELVGYTDSATTPTTIVQACSGGKRADVEQSGSISFPVLANDYYRVVQSTLQGSGGSFSTGMHFVPRS